jgi:hypothetical protein
MLAPQPRFGFTRADQKLLELALLDRSDREAAAGLNLSTEAIEKRGRSTYSKVAQEELGFSRPEPNGAHQRRALLQMLRNNLQEIRPYRERG